MRKSNSIISDCQSIKADGSEEIYSWAFDFFVPLNIVNALCIDVSTNLWSMSLSLNFRMAAINAILEHTHTHTPSSLAKSNQIKIECVWCSITNWINDDSRKQFRLLGTFWWSHCSVCHMRIKNTSVRPEQLLASAKIISAVTFNHTNTYEVTWFELSIAIHMPRRYRFRARSFQIGYVSECVSFDFRKMERSKWKQSISSLHHYAVETSRKHWIIWNTWI